MSFIKNKFRALYMAAFIIFTVIFTIMMPDGHTAMWFAMLTALLGTISTVMFAQKNIWAYVPSFVFNFMYMYICWESRLWLEFGEYIFYNVTMVYGVYAWYKQLEKDKTHVSPKRLSPKAWVASIVATIVLTVGFGTFDKFVLDGAVPYMDALSISFTVIAQILIVTCYREQWFFWFVLDAISIVTFALIGEWAMVAMYVCWFINTIYGWIEWSHNEKKIETDTVEA